MNRRFKLYALIWVVVFALFNAVVFLARPILPGYEVRYDARFWVVWVGVLASLVCNLVCANIALKEENLKKVFYKIPLITYTGATLVGMLIVGCILMLVPDLPAWIAAIVCVLMLAADVLAVFRAVFAAEAVGYVDEKINAQTAFIKSFTAEAENALDRAKSDEVKAACRRVYEAARYSDPMSAESLSGIEADLTVKMDGLSAAVAADDAAQAKALAEEIESSLAERNRICKLNK